MAPRRSTLISRLRRWIGFGGGVSLRRRRSKAVKRYIKAVDKGLLKVMSKMGISTYQSYCGAQIFDCLGLSQSFVDEFFTGTTTRIEGVGLEEIAAETVRRHRLAFSDAPVYKDGARRRRRLRLPHRGEAHSLDAADRLAAAARRARQRARQDIALSPSC